MDGDKTDSLSRQGKRFRERRQNNTVGVGLENAWDRLLVKDDPAIGFIGNDDDVVAEAGSGFFQKASQGSERFLGVDLAGGVVGRVDHDGLGLRGDGLFDGVQIQVELLIRVDHLAYSAVIIHVKIIFDKIRGEQDHLFPRIQDGLEHDIERACRTAGHQGVAGLNGNALLLGNHRGDGLPHMRVTGIGHIGMDARGVVRRYVAEYIAERLRRGDIRVSQAEVEDVLLSELRPHPGAFLEHFPDHRGACCKSLHFIRNWHELSPKLYVIF